MDPQCFLLGSDFRVAQLLPVYLVRAFIVIIEW